MCWFCNVKPCYLLAFLCIFLKVISTKDKLWTVLEKCISDRKTIIKKNAKHFLFYNTCFLKLFNEIGSILWNIRGKPNNTTCFQFWIGLRNSKNLVVIYANSCRIIETNTVLNKFSVNTSSISKGNICYSFRNNRLIESWLVLVVNR